MGFRVSFVSREKREKELRKEHTKGIVGLQKPIERDSSEVAKAEAKSAEAGPVEEKNFPIVGVGASAGGLEAFTKLLEGLPDDTRMAFVFIQHLAPGQESMLTDILSRSSKMPVHKVQNDMPVKPNNVYVIPPDVSMTISDRVLKLQREVARMHRPVDQFLISLAQDVKNLAIGVILSGTGTDGTEGLKAIYAEGGITFAQEEDTAKYPGMPHSAVSAGIVNFVLSPEKIADELARIGKHPYLNHEKLRIIKPKIEEVDKYQAILSMLKLAFNVNFAAYKESTINRRISRRMVLHQLDRIDDYVKLLREDRAELQALFDDLLIGVTSFFREPETFQILIERVYPVIFKNRSPESVVRVWVPGCATGEEAYSIALSLKEYMDKNNITISVQVFGTDISDKNIEKARAGLYPDTISESVSEERLKRFFTKSDQKYQVHKSIRDMCVFAKQDLTRDPPFSNLDLISCRNVLIYLKPEAQKRIIPLFHYALKPNGFLVLGKSETAGGFEDLFSSQDKTPIYVKKAVATRLPLEMELHEPYVTKPGQKKKTKEEPLDNLQKEAQRILLSRFAPSGVIVNYDLEVCFFQGNTSKFLSHGPGEASFNLLDMAKQELRLELQTALYLARKQKEPVKREGIQFKDNGQIGIVDIEILPLTIPQFSKKFFLILFEQGAPQAEVIKGKGPKRVKIDAKTTVIDGLERELASTKETLQTIIEEQEATNEELRAALEEVQSSNEELQSTNEELETAKEELQSTNEELNTVNEELSRRHKELTRVHDDLSNLFNNVDMIIIVLDPELRIRLFTPTAEKAFNLIPSDVGRPIQDISLGVNVPNFEEMVRDVIENLRLKQLEVQDRKGRWYVMRLRPYLTAEKKIDGVVLSFVDIDAIVQGKTETEKARNFAETVLTTMQEPLVVLDDDLKVTMANPSFYETFGIDTGDAVGKNIFKIGNKQWQIPQFKEALEKTINDGEVADLIIDHTFPKIGRRVLSINLGKLSSQSSDSKIWVLTLQDITHQKQIEEGLLKNKQELETIVEDRTKKLHEAQRLAVIGQTAGMVGHDIRNPLQSIVSATYLLKEELPKAIEGQTEEQTKEILESVATIEEQAQYIDKIVSDLQEFSKPLAPINQEVDLNALIKSLLAKLKIPDNVKVENQTDNNLNKVQIDPTCIIRILTNLITNAIQAMPKGGKIIIGTHRNDENVVLTVEDTGEGIPDEIKPRIFQPLVTSKSKGQGFGLAVCKRLVEAMKGDITFESEKGKGTKFTIKLPTEK